MPATPSYKKIYSTRGGGATLTHSGALIFGVGGVCGVGFLLVTDLMEN